MRILIVVGLVAWWSNFCKKHLIDDDPYQYDHITTERLWKEYRETRSESVRRELTRRYELSKGEAAE